MLRTITANKKLSAQGTSPSPSIGNPQPEATWQGDELIREELLGLEALERHTEDLARHHRSTRRQTKPGTFTARLAQNELALQSACRKIGEAVARGMAITPAAEWFIDNYHLVEDQIREIRLDLPAGYYRQLPSLPDGPLKSLPRVLSLAWHYVAHTDSLFEPTLLCRFINAYQRVQPLTIGELWAVPISLRVMLIENLRRATKRILANTQERESADALADLLIGEHKPEPQRLQAILGPYEKTALSAAFAAQLAKRLRDQDPTLLPAMQWLEDRLTPYGLSSDAVVQDQHLRQASMIITVRNIITSMRHMSAVDWTELFESVSTVDALLRSASTFGDYDFPTRDQYRKSIEELSRGSGLNELDVTQKVLDACTRAAADADLPDDTERRRMSDPGYHLVAAGRRRIERQIRFRPAFTTRFARMATHLGYAGYVGAIAITTVAGLALAFAWMGTPFTSNWWPAFAALALLPMMDAAVAIVNRIATRQVLAKTLPSLELKQGVPSEMRTLVAIPTMLTSMALVRQQLEGLEVHYLSSQDPELHFALLTDWTDAVHETTDKDQSLLDCAVTGIAVLNERYGPAAGGDRFLLLHRRRVWNPVQKTWMGWERKRGKLHELNQALRGANDTTFITHSSSGLLTPSGIRYVITLDADTRLPSGTARKLIGKMAHPLNRPRFDRATGRVLEGYAILQPRMTATLPSGKAQSFFQRIYSSGAGVDPYTSAVSDVYQDLFGEGSYAGKGIYDIDVFEAAMANRVPENTLLSHDLFEGIFARAGLVSDIELFEDFPTRYDVAATRLHRWARGDWQLLPWILGRTTTGSNLLQPFLPLGSLWKMTDNLRRTLSAPVCILALALGWTLPLHEAEAWTAFILATIILPPLLPLTSIFVPPRSGMSWLGHWRSASRDLAAAVVRIAFTITFLAHQAWMMMDAIARTSWRLLVTHRRMLDWVTAAQADIKPRPDVAGAFSQMAGAIVIGIGALLLSIISSPLTAPLALPFAALWVLSPLVARWSSQSPLTADSAEASSDAANRFRMIARLTWRYFETFVTDTDNNLPPDNFQEAPEPVVAHRTSPTNIGLYLLSTVAARDLGWIGTADMAARLDATFDTLSRLELVHGHLLNWYDTQTLQPLEPKYISSVDSGNLAGHLIAVANGCMERSANLFAEAEVGAGALDALALAADALKQVAFDDTKALSESLSLVRAFLSQRPSRRPTETEMLRARELTHDLTAVASSLAASKATKATATVLHWCEAAERSLESHARDTAAAPELQQRLKRIADRARSIVNDMDFRFLINDELKLLSIGYVVSTGTMDTGCYDLLASEARLASFVAMAKGDAPTSHWFRLGRLLTPVRGGAALVSWSGSMFEYLMPSLVMRAPEGSLLATSNRAVVARQIEYGKRLSKPWGVSESAYNTRDLNYTYQYSNFGIPGLGLKRGLSDNYVVAPYATALAAMVNPGAAHTNFQRLDNTGAKGRYGYYEAIDFTTSRLPKGAQYAIVEAWMAHHQGMTIVALANVVSDGRMRTRFHVEPRIRAIDLLLQERMPREVALARPRAEEVMGSPKLAVIQTPTRTKLLSPHATPPATLLMSNGRYTTMLTAAGGGFSRWGELAVTRWREDQTCDDFGPHVYLRADRSGEAWSSGYQPTAKEPDAYTVDFQSGRGEISRRDGKFTTTTDVITSPESDGDVRRVSITNHDVREHEIEVTYYTELVLAPAAADWAHLTFSKLFVETDYIADRELLLGRRRRRSPEEAEIWVAMHAVVEGDCIGGPQIETDRNRFLGRGRTPRNPIALSDWKPLSNTVGAVLDPCFAHRQRMRVPAGSTIRIAYWTWAGNSRDNVLALAEKHRTPNAYERVTTLAWSQAQIERYHLGITPSQVDSYQRLASHMLAKGGSLRAPQRTIERGLQPASALWAHGISGDRPIILVRIEEEEDLKFIAEVLRAHEYWQRKTLFVDLVILNDKTASYVQELQSSLQSLIRISEARRQHHTGGSEGKIFILRRTDMTAEARLALQAAARVELVSRRGTLIEQLDRLDAPQERRLKPEKIAPHPARPHQRTNPHGKDLEYFNGIGGFGSDGREYVIDIRPGQNTPAPWLNIISNEHFGFQVSADGGGFTWSGSSRENQITEWVNDPVSDRPPEILYIRDDETGEIWSATPSPIRLPGASYLVRHGQGYSRFEHTSDGLAVYMLQYVTTQDPLKITRLTIRNTSRRPRHLTVTSYVEWLLAPPKGLKTSTIVTSMDSTSGALFARSPSSNSYATQVAFSGMTGQPSAWTCDRTEFLGRNGSIANPIALARNAQLSGHSGAGLDPCAALQRKFTLAPGTSIEVACFLGVAHDDATARTLMTKYRAADLDRALDDVTEFWDQTLGRVQVTTPDRSMDIMLNRWLLYQTIACRLWARSAFYQSGGAYGFRDQLQDAMALTTALPSLTREHLLRAAARQFVEGDVQHWWLAQSGLGIRTSFSDDRIWLAIATANYVLATGDNAVLQEEIPFLLAPKLEPGQTEAYSAADISAECATLFEHCARALDTSLAVGPHGLPLIGSGDWNDGFNHIGRGGKGESIWLGWFLYSGLKSFLPIALARGETGRARNWQLHCDLLQSALERDGWDGDWYRRAFFDDGTSLGSGTNAHCRIDSIAQSWAVLSGAAEPDRARRAMDAVDTLLIDRSNGVAMLFTPPFDNAPVDPGYVAGYPPGIRENGGQYTHAAVWSAMAFAALGQGDKAANLFWMLNPINRSRTLVDAQRYRVEPYAVAADVYSVSPHVGRGGWTWYTGAAGWLYRAGLESILGFRMEGDMMHLNPCIPGSWPGFEIRYLHGTSLYQITVKNPGNVSGGVTHVSIDAIRLPDPHQPVPLIDDGKPHTISILMG